MCKRFGRMPWCLAWLFFVANGLCASPTADQLQRWAKELEADAYGTRESASEHLTAAGDAGIDTLCVVVAADSGEGSWRALSALEQIALRGSAATAGRVAAALQQIAAQGKPNLANVANQLVARQLKARRDRAVARVLSLGGKLEGDETIFLAKQKSNPGGDNPSVVTIDKHTAVTLPDPPPNLPDDETIPHADAAQAATGEGSIGEAYVSPLLSGITKSSDQNTSLTIDQDWLGGDAELTVLGELSQVTSLSLVRAPLSDAAVEHIAMMPHLATVEIESTPITSAGLSKLRQQRPLVRVHAHGSARLGILAEP